MSDEPPPLAPSGAPKVWTWYVVYCVLMALMSLAFAACGVIVLVAGTERSPAEAARMQLGSWICIVTGAPLTLAFASAPFLPRRPWVWVFHVVLISVGLMSLCIAPASIPLLIHWLKPETKARFGVVT